MELLLKKKHCPSAVPNTGNMTGDVGFPQCRTMLMTRLVVMPFVFHSSLLGYWKFGKMGLDLVKRRLPPAAVRNG